MYQIQITTQASKDLSEAVNYISETLHNPSAALHLLDETDTKLNALADFPERNPLVQDNFLAANGIRMQMIGNYLALYAVRESSKTVVILRILYGKRDWMNILKQDF